jgi:Uma2 family endonuclease
VDLPNRQSFSPDAAYYEGPRPGMRFYEGAPRFAAEVRSENDYGPTAEQEMRDKRRDYFAAGTLTIWDVDLQSGEVVRRYDASDADTPAAVFRRGDIADAGAAVPGWSLPVDDLFEPQGDEAP